MRKVLAFTLLAIAGVAFGTVLSLRSYAASDDKAQIAALFGRVASAISHRDLNGIMSVYVPNQTLFVFDVTPPRQHVGWNDYRNDWKQVFGMFTRNPQFRMQDLDTTVSGDVAYSHSIQSVNGSVGHGKNLSFTVRVTDVLRKINGKWLIVQEHVSVPVDVMTGKADLQSRP